VERAERSDVPDIDKKKCAAREQLAPCRARGEPSLGAWAETSVLGC
jgi:hypothetical protein